MLAFAITIFAGAFLLFQVQPLIAKFILPWFGGSPGVWTTCMLFFQVLLLGGYAYAHLVSTRLRPRAQAIVHLVLLAVAALLLPITPNPGWKPASVDGPEIRILALLAACVGIQALVLASTGPLVQNWFTRARPGVSPYRLYALSNLGSLLALVSYPFLVEPNLTRIEQARMWSWGFGAFVLCSGTCALLAARARGVEQARASAPAAAPSLTHRVLWFLLPACGCVLLLATTNQICVDVAVIPFLWVLPLSLYLLSFILVFQSPRWYPRVLYGILLPIAVGGTAVLLEYASHRDISIVPQIAAFAATLFICCMVCHGETVRLKPDPSHLTAFYLMIAAGGAAGGIFVALIAPFVFRGYFEFHIGLLACCVLALAVYALDERSVLRGFRPRWAWVLFAVIIGTLGWGLAYEARRFTADALIMTRNFYGVLSVVEEGTHARSHRYVLSHGSTMHGYQFDDPEKRQWPTSYYGPGSGVGLSVRNFPREGSIKIGAVGLGVGTVATWGDKGDSIRFYEINPQVVHLARTRFTYLADSPADVQVVLGDARISLEREPPQNFDVLVLDAFSGDAIPVHLLTKDAFEIYLRHMQPDGVIAVHISNAYLDLQPVLYLIADYFGMDRVLIQDTRAGDMDDADPEETEYDRAHGLTSSTWVLLGRNPLFFDSEEIVEAAYEPDEVYPGVRLWTDDDTNLFRILHRD